MKIINSYLLLIILWKYTKICKIEKPISHTNCEDRIHLGKEDVNNTDNGTIQSAIWFQFVELYFNPKLAASFAVNCFLSKLLIYIISLLKSGLDNKYSSGLSAKVKNFPEPALEIISLTS